MTHKLWATIVLIWRFISSLVASAWATSIIIITASDAPHRKLIQFTYGDLNIPASLLLASLVSLTPGTTVVDIDSERKELLLHVLDSTDLETTLSTIERNFIVPLRILFGGRS